MLLSGIKLWKLIYWSEVLIQNLHISFREAALWPTRSFGEWLPLKGHNLPIHVKCFSSWCQVILWGNSLSKLSLSSFLTFSLSQVFSLNGLFPFPLNRKVCLTFLLYPFRKESCEMMVPKTRKNPLSYELWDSNRQYKLIQLLGPVGEQDR